jgi:hypothetical protein
VRRIQVPSSGAACWRCNAAAGVAQPIDAPGFVLLRQTVPLCCTALTVETT